ncbi:hypothetical protein PGQ11_006662 [Apiospora arundinis]|uniref:Uncharacterized protein n=1 Tax=Apiospora arundinis TaxID=335852 RepID=A0ABR2ITB8_9PEZI
MSGKGKGKKGAGKGAKGAKGGKGQKRKLVSGVPTDGVSSATLHTANGNLYQGQDIDFEGLAPRYKRARIGIDRDPAVVDDHHPDLDNRGCPGPNNFVVPLHSMNRLQENREDHITPRSLVSALLWEQAQLSQPDIATVVNFDGWPLFEQEDGDFGSVMRNWEPEQQENGRLIYDDVMNYMRKAEYVFWPYQFRSPQDAGENGATKGSWVLIVMRVEEMVSNGRTLINRYASDVAIVDPKESGRAERHESIKKRLRTLLEYTAHIQVDKHSWVGDSNALLGPESLQPGKDWATGHACYQHAHELFRRLRIVLQTGHRGKNVYDFWNRFQEGYNPELARKLMLAACAHRTIEKSEYYGRLAVEFPGFANSRGAHNYRPSDLDPRSEQQKDIDRTDDGVMPDIMVGYRAEDIGLWSMHLDADQRWEGSWVYIEAPGERTNTRDDRRYVLTRGEEDEQEGSEGKEQEGSEGKEQEGGEGKEQEGDDPDL